MSDITISKHTQALIFDLDGTLADTMPAHYIAWHQTLKKYGINFTEELFYRWAGMPTFKIVAMLNDRFGTQLSPMDIHHEKEALFLTFISTIKPVEKVATVARKYNGILPMAIGTGGVPDVVEATLKAIGMQDMFKVIVTSLDVKNYKPAPDTFLLCAEKMGVEPHLCHVFEDGEPGIAAAQNAGMSVTDVRPFYTR